MNTNIHVIIAPITKAEFVSTVKERHPETSDFDAERLYYIRQAIMALLSNPTMDESTAESLMLEQLRLKDNSVAMGCFHSFVDKDNEGIYGIEYCRFCGLERSK